MLSHKEKILKIIEINEKLLKDKNNSWKFLENVDKEIKRRLNYQWFWFYEIDKNIFNKYEELPFLLYYSRTDEFEISNDYIQIKVIKKRINKIDNEKEILNNLNILIWNINDLMLLDLFSNINIKKYENYRKLSRIILYVQQKLNKWKNIKCKKIKWKRFITLWDDLFWDNLIWNAPIIDNELKIKDYWLWKMFDYDWFKKHYKEIQKLKYREDDIPMSYEKYALLEEAKYSALLSSSEEDYWIRSCSWF